MSTRQHCTTTECVHFRGTESDGHASGHCAFAKYDEASGIGITGAGYRRVFDSATAKRPEPRSASYCWHTPVPFQNQGRLSL